MSSTKPEFREKYRLLRAEMVRRGYVQPGVFHFYRDRSMRNDAIGDAIPAISPNSAKPQAVVSSREREPWPAGARQPGGGHFRGLFEWDRTQECRKGGDGTDDEGFGVWNYRMGEVVFVREMKRAFWR